MNSNMNNNLDGLYHELLASFQQQSKQQHFSLNQGSDVAMPDSDLTPLSEDALWSDSLTWDDPEWDLASSDGGESAQTPQPFPLGDFSTVQKRFQTLLKQRLYTEIQHNPPRFPWESSADRCTLDYSDDTTQSLSTAQRIWLPHLADVLPVALPPLVLAQLLETCNQVVGSIRPQAAKMVNAVQPLFPDYAQTLNEVMGRIRLSPSLCPTRFSAAEQQHQRDRLAAILPTDYYEASVEQQMVIALLVAKQVLDLLAVTLSPSQPQVERLWMTNAGIIRLAINYDPETARGGDWMSQTPLRARVQLPGAGTLALTTAQESITAQRTTAGYLSVELSNWDIETCYLLTVGLDRPVPSSLKFAITCQV
ncbi:hypothetical protein [Spirulina major]|uniref:hypothetical protein n=1 Tax=Spirulina major TaxID=270636 RepID=UPI001114D49C|nr:hypothetical protein [Spirulina major]